MRYLVSIAVLIMMSCGTTTSQGSNEKKTQPKEDLSNYSKAYFASGCFWCVEAIYESVNGVAESISGYAGGHTKNPTYASSNTGKTGHAEAVEIYYDPNIISFETLVQIYYASQDPTQVNGQGNDRGSQYRSIIFYQDENEKQIAESYKSSVAKEYKAPIATEIVPFEKFWLAEEYHQDFERRNPNQPYVRAVSVPRLNRFKAKHPELLKENLNH